MKMRTNRLLKTVAAAVAAGVVAVPAAFGSGPTSPDTQDAAKAGPPASIVDMRSPDTQEAAKAGRPASIVDMRSPDTQEAAKAGRPGSVPDMIAPDTQDAANGRQLSPTVEVVTVAAPSHFDWLDAGIGVAFGLGASLVAAGALLIVLKRRRRALLST